MPLIEKIQQDMVAAMKAKDRERLGPIRLIKTALKKLEVDGGKPLDESAELKVLSSLVKQRKDSSKMYRQGDREELAAKEESELAIIESYMPAKASGEELAAAVASAIASTGAGSMKQMGLVMKAAREALAGKTVDGKALSEKVKAKLG